jgi:hypothetical protein
MDGKPISFDGIIVPSDNPWFLTLIAVHVLAAMICVIAGAVAMLARKGRGRHPVAGTIYFFGLIVVFATVTIISALRWKEDYHLFVLGLLSLGAATTGRTAKRRQWQRWPVYHVIGMGTSYIVLLTAFYVDNGKFLPVWKEFPSIVYWTLPAVVGTPIIIYTLLRHTIVRGQNRPE